jgi:hypothetical protein
MSLLKLQKLIESGETLIYRGKVAVIKSYDLKHGNYEIIVDVDNKPMIFTKQTEEHISLWLVNFTQPEAAGNIEESVVVIPKSKDKPSLPDVYTENKKQMQSLSQILLEDIQKVRDNPSYVAQAKQVCNSVNAIVNITKLHIIMTKHE